MTSATARIQTWLESLGIDTDETEALAGDVSPRKYFRLAHPETGSAVLAVYPIESTADAERFLATTRWFESAQIRVPRILNAAPEQGLVLLEDLGSRSLYDLTTKPWPEIEPFVEQALEAASKLVRANQAEYTGLNPPLDARRLASELAQARELFLNRSDFSGSATELEGLDRALDDLCRALENEPLVPTHRDFMSRNLMLPADGTELAVIDHQDACLAPRHYDQASLLNDSLFPSPEEEERWLRRIAAKAESARGYRRCAVQRTLKASATFVRFAFAGFERHLPLVAPCLERAAHHLAQLPEGKAVSTAIFDRWRDSAAVNRGITELLARSQSGEC